jgi:hypothetical protein
MENKWGGNHVFIFSSLGTRRNNGRHFVPSSTEDIVSETLSGPTESILRKSPADEGNGPSTESSSSAFG